jgi:integrase
VIVASIFKRDGSWVVKWKNGAGRWMQRRTSCATKLEAQELARELERKAEFQRHGLEPIEGPVSLTFGDLLEWYEQHFAGQLRSQGDRLAAEKHLRPRLGTLALPEVTAARLDEALSAVEDALSPKSLNNLRGFAQTLFSKAIQRGLWKGANPADAVPRRKVPKRAPSYLRAEEVGPVLAQVPTEWRCLFATAVYTGMRRGELVALQKGDVDLEQGEIVVTRSWDAGTTKSGRARVVPIHHELRPYLVQAMRESSSALVFPRSDGSMQSPNVDLAELLRSALNRAQLVEGWAHKCRRCGHVEHAASSEVRRCSKSGCGFMLWPSPKPRAIRFHDLRHTTATLLLKARVPLAVVQRILGHSSPTVTAGVYGHLDVDDMRAGLEQLSFRPVEEPAAEVLHLAVGGPHGAPVVRSLGTAVSRPSAPKENPEARGGVTASGPSWIRTRDQSVMSRQL